MRQREEIIKTWLDMWLGQELLPLEAVFTPTVHYYEFQGRAYEGIDEIRCWFDAWNRENHVTKWDVHRFIHHQDTTMVEFYFQSENTHGESCEWEGIYLVEWDSAHKIEKLQEFYCHLPHVKPFA